MADDSIHEQLLEPEVILTVRQEEEDRFSSSLNFSTVQNYNFMPIEMDSEEVSSVDVSFAAHIGKKISLCDGIGKQTGDNAGCSFAQHQGSMTSFTEAPSQDGRTSSKSHVCDTCGKGFVLRSNLKQHMLVHTGIKPHVCSECGKSFTQLSNLKTHSIVHTGEKPHVCGVCGKAYTSLHNLKAHDYVHTGQKKRHICETCGQGFYQRGDLKTHNLIHTGQKPHVCCICGKGFIKRGDLNVHMVVHTGDKPHACELCGKRFAQRWKLMKHSLVHTRKLAKGAVMKDIK
jgi:uncharacterized Zn-finger protein